MTAEPTGVTEGGEAPTTVLEPQMVGSTERVGGYLERGFQVGLYPVARLVVWMVFYLSLLLGGWVLVGMGLGGWSPVVVTSGSMEPAVSVGDVLLIDGDASGTIAQRSIVVFERSDGTVVAHRVFSVEGDQLVTKGDANPSPDTDRVETAEVRGVARVLVPLVGLPAVWRAQGNVVPLVVWLLLSVVGAVHFVMSATSGLRTRSRSESAGGAVGQVGIRRVRVLIAALIVAQFAVDPARLELFGSSRGQIPLFVGVLVVLLGANLVSSVVRSDRWRSRLPLIELGVDTLLVVVLSTLTGSSGLGWVLFALPIIEAAVRFGLVGALNHWMILTTLTIAARIWVFEYRDTTDLLSELENTLDQMSVLFLVVVPGAYLAEQLLGDVAEQRRALDRVVARSDLLERVADSGRRVSQLDGNHVDAVIEGTRRLGFDAVDLVFTTGEDWRKLGGSSAWDLPVPGEVASGLTESDLLHGALLIDGDHAEERHALETYGLGVVITSAIAVSAAGRAVLRAGVQAGRTLTLGEIDAFRLLAGQAAVALQNHELLSEITSIHGELEHQAHHDALTGLPNRVMLLDSLDEALDNDARPALMFLDLDGFKPVNDRLGHDAGDDLLCQVGQRLITAAPRDALVARIGGDEFTILLRGAPTEARAGEIASAVAALIEEPFAVNGESVRIGTSIGVAFGDASVRGAELIRRADVSMYVAKHGTGREAYEFYRPELDQAEARRALLVEDLEQAMLTNEISLVFQPVVLTSGDSDLVGVEALVRWDHPTLGPIAPPELLEATRIARLGAELHRHIAFGATQMLANWLHRFPNSPTFVTINASPEDLASSHLVSNVVAAVRNAGVSPARVFVEISEQLVSPDAPGVMGNIHALRKAGVRLLLDDFGEGQTSLSYIHELPVAGIKLDRKLVVNALRSETDRIVIESIVALCARLGLVVIAEGIETAEHMDVVRAVGCAMAQGYHLGVPQSEAELMDSQLAGGGVR